MLRTKRSIRVTVSTGRKFVGEILQERGDAHVAYRADRVAGLECGETGDVDNATSAPRAMWAATSQMLPA